MFAKVIWVFSMLLSSADFFNVFQKYFQDYYKSECQTVQIQIRTDIMSVLIWVINVCKGYMQTSKITTSKERVNKFYDIFPNFRNK